MRKPRKTKTASTVVETPVLAITGPVDNASEEAQAPLATPESDEPTAAEIAAALASIDPAAEVAATSGVLDHSSQYGSWIGEEAGQDRLVDEAIAELEKLETASDDQDEPSLNDLINAVPSGAAEKMVFRIADAIDERATFEYNKKPDNLKIQSTLKKARTQMVTLRAAKLLVAVNCDTAWMNRSVHEGSRYNVYAYGKLSDVVYGVTGGVISNAINIHVMRSLFAVSKAGLTFDLEAAKGACSRDYVRKNPDEFTSAVKRLLISYTVGATTAPTQASSTMQALTTLGVVRRYGSSKNPSYALVDGPLTRQLQEKLAA